MANCGHDRIEVVSRCPDCGQELGHATRHGSADRFPGRDLAHQRCQLARGARGEVRRVVRPDLIAHRPVQPARRGEEEPLRAKASVRPGARAVASPRRKTGPKWRK